MQHTWIFQIRNELTDAQKKDIQAGLDRLTAEWKAHGTPVPGKGEVRYNHFVIVQAEPGSTSGCSIDSMTRGVESLLADLKLSHLGPEIIYYRANGTDEILHMHFQDIRLALRDGTLNEDTVVFDASLSQTSDLNNWEVPLKKTWMKRFLVNVA